MVNFAELLKGAKPKGDEAAERAEAKKREGKCLVLFAHGKGLVLTWMAGEYMAEFVSADGDTHEGGTFTTDRCDLRTPLDGLYIGEFKFVDDGPSDWGSHYREYALGIRNMRPATAEEWAAHLRDEWPWEPLEGSRFYEKDVGA